MAASDITLHKVDEVYMRIECEKSILWELSDAFSFEAPGVKFMPAFRMKLWDGIVRLVNRQTAKCYCGLEAAIREFAESRGYSISGEINAKYTISKKELEYVLSTFDKTARDYQLNGFIHALESTRAVILSPTSSGKSLLIYMLYRWLLAQSKRLLIIVPTTSLVLQMKSDFEDYAKSDLDIGIIMSGHEKVNNCSVVISTWQSIVKLPKSWFKAFDAVIGDECLHPDTKISMADNTKKYIKNIEIGDYVKTFNEKTKKIENKKVLKLHENLSIDEDFYEIETKNGNILKITGNHKVLLTNGKWVEVKYLREGDIINSIE
jgi:hypothetical protein